VKYVKRWNLKSVVGFQRKADIQDVCRELTDSNPGTKKYIGGYQKALSKVVNELTEEEQEEYRAMAKEWTKRSPPVEVQRK
jgi:hypothetical protein